MNHKIMALFQSTGPGKTAAVSARGRTARYIITASLRRQWERRRGNCALRRGSLPIVRPDGTPALD
jgi:hypothetical protein